MVDATEFRNLLAASQAWQPGDGVPTLASDELTELAFTSRNSVFLGRSYVGLEFLGPVTQAPEGWLTEGPYIVVAWEVLEQMPTDEPLALNTLLVGGPRAIDVVAESPVVDQSTVITRASWLGLMRDSALIGGVETMMTIAVLAVGVLAAVALLVTVLRGVRSRGQALVMLRTQGMRNRYGWWLALTELAPLTIAAVVGGALAGLAMVAVLGSTLGLEVLSGGIAAPTLDINPTFVAAVGGAVAALLFAAIAAEVATHRRHKLSDVLRQGQSGEGA